MKFTEDFIQREQKRADCYRLLAACYCTPEKEFIEEGLVQSLTAALDGVCKEAVPFAGQMEDALLKYTNLQLLIDYSALFIGPMKLLAAPYGSVHLEEGRRVMGESTVEVIKFYRKAGVEMDPEQKDIPDHISVELEFMYYLISRGLEAHRNKDEAEALKFIEMQEDFLKKHLGTWAHKFAKDLKEGAKNPFYQNLADCMLTFLKADMEYLMTTYGAKGRA